MSPRAALATTIAMLAAAALAACGGDGGASCDPAGGPVSGAGDSHCTAAATTSPAACHPDIPDAGPTDPDAGVDEGYGDTMFGTEGDSDDCKYHISWTSTTICENGDITFTVTATNKTDDSALTGASPYIEAYLSDVHPAPNTDSTSSEKSGGVYEIGPMRFDAPGQWTVRFHFRADCEDADEESPHDHGAFFVDVP